MLAEFFSDLQYRFRALFSRSAVEQEMDEELRFHLQREAEKLMADGFPAAEAMRRARVAFGGVESVKEASRDGRGLALLETIAQDLRYAIRSLRRNPGFTIGVILTLGLGIGANAAMFGIVDRLLFRTPALPPRTCSSASGLPRLGRSGAAGDQQLDRIHAVPRPATLEQWLFSNGRIQRPLSAGRNGHRCP